MDTLQPMALPYGATTAATAAAPCGLFAPVPQQQQPFFFPSTVQQYQALMFQQQQAEAACAARAAAAAAAAFVAAVAPPASAAAAAAAPEAVVLPPAVAHANAASTRRQAAATASSSSAAGSSSCLALSGSLLSGSGSSNFGGRAGVLPAAEKKKTRRQEKRELWGAVVPPHVAKAYAARTGTPVYDNVLLFWYSNAHTKPLERGDSVALSVPADVGCEAAGAAASGETGRAQRRTPCVGVLMQRLRRGDVKPCFEPCADLKVLRLVSEGEAKHGVRSNGARHRRRSKGVKKPSAQVDLCVATPVQYLAEQGPVVSAATESTAPLSSGCSGASTPCHTACGDAADVDEDPFGMPPPQNSTDVAALQEALRHLLSAESNSDLSVAV